MAEEKELFSSQPLTFELEKLGLSDTKFLLPGEQVIARFGIDQFGNHKTVIYVKDIEVTGLDPDKKQAQYNVVGFRQYVQNWDLGGSYLNPEHIDPERLIG